MCPLWTILNVSINGAIDILFYYCCCTHLTMASMAFFKLWQLSESTILFGRIASVIVVPCCYRYRNINIKTLRVSELLCFHPRSTLKQFPSLLYHRGAISHQFWLTWIKSNLRGPAKTKLKVNNSSQIQELIPNQLHLVNNTGYDTIQYNMIQYTTTPSTLLIVHCHIPLT